MFTHNVWSCPGALGPLAGSLMAGDARAQPSRAPCDHIHSTRTAETAHGARSRSLTKNFTHLKNLSFTLVKFRHNGYVPPAQNLQGRLKSPAVYLHSNQSSPCHMSIIRNPPFIVTPVHKNTSSFVHFRVLTSVNVPKTRKTYCKGKDCKKHTQHKVTQYKAGKASLFAQGKRRYDRKQRGYGGQTKQIFRKKAKTTKKVVLRLECVVCKTKAQLPLKRCKHFELGGDKKQKGQALQF